MAWEINGQVGPHAEPGYDGHGWLWELVQEGRQARRVFVQVSGTAWAVDPESLASETRRAIETEGRSEVEKVLGEDEPPRMIGCDTHKCGPMQTGS
jgi:hypothetical protein